MARRFCPRHGYFRDSASCLDCEKERQRHRDRSRPPGWQRYDANYRRLREQVLAEETVCRLCKEPPDANDPLEVDHIVPRVRGGADVRENLRAVHRSCNRRRPRYLRTPAPPAVRQRDDKPPDEREAFVA